MTAIAGNIQGITKGEFGGTMPRKNMTQDQYTMNLNRSTNAQKLISTTAIV